MSRYRVASFVLVAVALPALCFLAACGGSGSSAGPPPPPPPPQPDFSLVLASPSVTVQQQGALQFQSVQANPLNGFTGTVTLELSGLSTGVTALPPGPYSLPAVGAAQGVSFQLSASAATPVATTTVTVTGTNGSISHSKTFTLVVTAVAPFAVQASPGSLSMGPASSVSVQVSVSANAGTSPQLGVTLSDLPTNEGVGLAPPETFLTPGNPVSFIAQAGALAQPLHNFPIVITASDGVNTSVVIVPLTVSVPFASNTAATRSTYSRTDGNPTAAVYDATRKLVFTTVETLNEVDVLSSIDGHRMATIPVEFPVDIDEAADGSAVYVVSLFSPYVSTIDPNLLQVVQRTVIPELDAGATSSEPPSASRVVALSSGAVLLAILNSAPSGSGLYLWTPTSNNFTELQKPPFAFPTSLVERSADHSKILFYGSPFAVVYDVTAGAFTSFTNIGDFAFVAISPDGSQIVGEALESQATTFFDSGFNVLGSIPLSIFPADGVIYSLDGRHAYAFGVFTGEDSPFVDAVAVLDTHTFSLTGVVSDFQLNGGSASSPFAIDETGIVFAGNAFPGDAQGVEFLDVSAPGFFGLPVPIPFLVQPSLLSLTAPTPAQLNGGGFSSASTYQVFVGAPPASPKTLMSTNVSVQSANLLNLTASKGTAPGPANVTLNRSDGFFEVMPDAVSFGPTILFVSANAGSPVGGDAIQVFGYGFDTQNLQVTIGGKSATIGTVSLPSPLQTINVTTPAGMPGIGDVTVTTADGSATAAGAFQYLASAQVFPIVGALDAIVYDQPRQRLYVSNQDHNRIEIFDLVTNTYLTPVAVGNQPASLALTPDGTLLAVIDLGDGTVSVINPATMQVGATYPVLTTADRDAGGCAGVPVLLSAAEPHRMLVDINCTALLSNGTFHLLNLDTGSLSCTGVAGCTPDGTDIAYDDGLAVMASTADGSKIFLAGTSLIDGQTVGLLDLTANTLTIGFQGTFTDAAVDADANIFSASFAVANSQLFRIGIMDDLSILNSGSQSLHNVFGEKLNPSGSLLFVPQDSGVDIFDVYRGRLAMHVALPESIPADTNGMALDETGTKMFLISNSGITIAQLFQAPLSLATTNPASGAPGTQVTLRGSGFQSGATVTWGTSETTAVFVDSNTLRATVPSISAGPARITVMNPNGQQYTFDAAFTVN